MKELIFADGRKVNIQSVTEAEGVMHIRMILITAEEIKALFGDEFATSRMVLTENYQEKEVYENYTDLKYIKEETGGIWEVEMRQTQADSDTRLDKLEEKSKKQEETLEKQGESLKSQGREIEKHTQTLTEQEANLTEQGKEIEKIKEDMQQSGTTPELQAAAMMVTRFQAQALPDALALEAKAIYLTFDQLVEQKFTAKEKGYKFRDGDDLYKTAQDNVIFQAQYRPGSGTESLYTHIDETHDGTLEDPIPWKVNMQPEAGKYYKEGDLIAKCIEDPGQALHNSLAELCPGRYFEKA